MDKSGVTEIRKLYRKKDDCYIKQIAYGYIGANKELLCRKRQLFMNMEEMGQHKFLELIRKGMGGSIGKNIETRTIADSEKRKVLQAIIGDNLQNEKLIENFYEEIAGIYPECENILVILITNTYDIPARGNDGHKNLEDSDEVYDFMQCFVCPVSLEEPGLQYNEKESRFEQKDTRWCVGQPYGSFLYPSFEERSADEEKVTIFMKKQGNPFTQILPELLDIDNDFGIMEQQEALQEVIETAVESRPDKVKIVQTIQEKVIEKMESLDNQVLTKEILSAVLEESGIKEENVEEAIACFDENVGDKELQPLLMIKKDLQIKFPDGVVKVNAAMKEQIETAVINGKKCLVISIEDGEPVEVNGVRVTL